MDTMMTRFFYCPRDPVLSQLCNGNIVVDNCGARFSRHQNCVNGAARVEHVYYWIHPCGKCSKH